MRDPLRATETPRELRHRLDQLDGLPIRAATARAVLARSDQDDDPTRGDPAGLDSRWAELDPGWALARSRNPGADPLAIVADRPWWSRLDPAHDAARDRLWRGSVAAARAARRIADESNDPGADDLAAAALLHRLGPWALAAVAPDRLADWLAQPDAPARRAFERVWLGRSAESLGRSLAERWGCPPTVIDANWLADDAGAELVAAARDPSRLARVRLAVAWVGRSPWALPTAPGRADAGIEPWRDDPRARLLVAEVQSRCGPGLAEADATAREEDLSRDGARRRIEVRTLRDELARRDALLDRLPVRKRPATLEAVADAWSALAADRERREADLEVAIEALRRRVEQASETLAREKLEALAEFAGGAGHELNNPLAVIAGRAQILLGRTSDPDATRGLRAILAQARRAHRIVRDLMYVARPTAPRPRPCVADEILREGLAELAPEAAARGVRLVDGTQPKSPRCWADPEALRHLADVFLRNALQATGPGGSVRAESAGDARRIDWTISDDGQGIDARAASRLFDPFYCGREAGRGLGLGLPRAARFVETAGGSIRWASAPARGTTFRIALPAAEPAAVGRAPAAG